MRIEETQQCRKRGLEVLPPSENSVKEVYENYYKVSLSHLINKEERFSSFSHSVVNKLCHSFSDFTEILCPRFLQIIVIQKKL